jgi:hypothetical protein
MGTCNVCGQWGSAFTFCGHCGEDTGCMFYPEQDTDYENGTPPHFSSDEETIDEEAFFDINTASPPTFLDAYKYQPMANFNDPFSQIPVVYLLSTMYDELSGMNVNKDEYISMRVKTMEFMGYTSINTQKPPQYQFQFTYVE